MSAQLIAPAFPTPNPWSLWSASHPSSVLPGTVAQFSSGRAAVHWAFRGLQLAPASVVWMPEYHCGVEVQAAIDAGMTVRYYRVQPDLTVDEAWLHGQLRAQPGPVLLVHYFG